MREFIYYSSTAPTTGSHIQQDLMKAGRLDIAIHTIISAFFLSHSIRENVVLHLVFDGPSDPTKHLELQPVLEGKTGVDKIYINKSNVSQIIKKMLYKYKPNAKNEVFPGYWIEKKALNVLIKELVESKRKIYVLDEDGEDIRTLDLENNPVFLLGDHKGMPSFKKELKRFKESLVPVSIGPKTYFASQTVAIVNNELDRREL